MSTKYNNDSSSSSTIVANDDGQSVVLSDHALYRWQQRTPADAEIGVREAWRLGDPVTHPEVASTGCDNNADEARVFRSTDGWSAVFIVQIDNPAEWGRTTERCVVTVLVIERYDHDPAQAYLEAYGPHDVGGER